MAMTLRKVIKEVLKVVPDAEVIILYGSRVNGKHTKDSDWDIRAIVPVEKGEDYTWADYQATLDCNILKQFNWNERTAPKIDLKVSEFIGEAPHRIVWIKKG